MVRIYRALVFGGVMAVGASSAIAGGPNGAITGQSETKRLINEAETVLCASLKDCDSAKFRNFHIYSDEKSDGTKQFIVCGEVNAKNSFGGYTGFQPFFYETSNHSVDVQDGPLGSFVAAACPDN